MNPSERQAAIERYAERLRRLGPVVQALGWRDPAQQELRFRVMSEGLVLPEGASVLDIGCGFGDLLEYFRSKGSGLRYTGCDISPDVLEVARNRHPDAQFDLRDILDEPYPERSFDFVLMSGIFNHRLEDNEGFLERMLTCAHRMCVQGIAANMTTDQVDFKEGRLYYFNPERVLKFCHTLSRRVAMRHDYPLYEFTVFVYR